MRSALVLVLALAACEGPMGPEGPQGPQGLQGEAGPGTRLTFSGQLVATEAKIALPEEVGTLANPPAISVYIASSELGPFFPVSDGWDLDAPYWSLGQVGGILEVRLWNVFEGWYYRIVVTY